MSEDPAFSISEVAAMVGLSAHTIRIWERRYGMITPRRSRAGHRRYGLEDVQMLQQMKQAADTRDITLKMAALEALGELPAQSWPAGGPESKPGGDVLADDSPWRAAADVLPQPILLIHASGQIADANVAFARASGFIREKLRGIRFSELVDPYERPKATAIWREPRTRRGWELNLRTPMGSGLYSFDCWPLQSKGHQVIVLVGRDMSRTGLELWPGETGREAVEES